MDPQAAIAEHENPICCICFEKFDPMEPMQWLGKEPPYKLAHIRCVDNVHEYKRTLDERSRHPAERRRR